jgi:hypothetical protein
VDTPWRRASIVHSKEMKIKMTNCAGDGRTLIHENSAQ